MIGNPDLVDPTVHLGNFCSDLRFETETIGAVRAVRCGQAVGGTVCEGLSSVTLPHLIVNTKALPGHPIDCFERGRKPCKTSIRNITMFDAGARYLAGLLSHAVSVRLSPPRSRHHCCDLALLIKSGPLFSLPHSGLQESLCSSRVQETISLAVWD
jgi:hypothetical protein